jgi:hypothetical protein
MKRSTLHAQLYAFFTTIQLPDCNCISKRFFTCVVFVEIILILHQTIGDYS